MLSPTGTSALQLGFRVYFRNVSQPMKARHADPRCHDDEYTTPCVSATVQPAVNIVANADHSHIHVLHNSQELTCRTPPGGGTQYGASTPSLRIYVTDPKMRFRHLSKYYLFQKGTQPKRAVCINLLRCTKDTHKTWNLSER